MLAVCASTILLSNLLIQGNLRRHGSQTHEGASMWLQAVSNADHFEEDEDTLCVVCLDNLREVIFYNCMHMVRSCTLGSVMGQSM